MAKFIPTNLFQSLLSYSNSLQQTSAPPRRAFGLFLEFQLAKMAWHKAVLKRIRGNVESVDLRVHFCDWQSKNSKLDKGFSGCQHDNYHALYHYYAYWRFIRNVALSSLFEIFFIPFLHYYFFIKHGLRWET